MGLHELAPVGRWPAGWRDGWRLERFAEVCQELPDRRWVGDERDQPDVAAARWALQGKLFSHPRHELGPRNPRRVVRAGLLIHVTAASVGMPGARMPALGSLTLLADIPDGECRHGPHELVIRRKHPVIPVLVLPQWRHEIREPVEKLNRRELDNAVCPSPRGLSRAGRADPVGGFVSRQHVADAAARVMSYREPLQREGRPGAIPQTRLAAGRVDFRPRAGWRASRAIASGWKSPTAERAPAG